MPVHAGGAKTALLCPAAIFQRNGRRRRTRRTASGRARGASRRHHHLGPGIHEVRVDCRAFNLFCFTINCVTFPLLKLMMNDDDNDDDDDDDLSTRKGTVGDTMAAHHLRKCSTRALW